MVPDSWIETKKYWNDAVKEENMGDPRNLAGAFYRNAGAYAGVALQIGSNTEIKIVIKTFKLIKIKF